MRESDIQHQIIKFLEAAGWYPVKIIQSNKNGWPDLQAHLAGHTIFIEVKSETGKLSELQKYRHKQLTQFGFHVITTNNLNHFTHEFLRISTDLFNERHLIHPN
jgi:Holliday junction resolvase